MASLARKKFNAVVVFGALIFLFFNSILNGQTAAPRTSAEHKLAIGFVQKTGEFDGAGCSLWLATDHASRYEHYVSLSDFENRAIININGRDTALTLVHSREPKLKREAKKGDRSSYRYRGSGVEVDIKYLVSGVCAPDDESCEVIYYDATITVTARSAKRVLATQGLCGS